MPNYTVTVAVKADTPDDARLIVSPDETLNLSGLGIEEYEILAVGDAREVPTHEAFAQALAAKLPKGTKVDVSEWAGCDEPWLAPVYVIAEDPDEQVEYYDAICDLASAPVDEQVAFVLEQLKEG